MKKRIVIGMSGGVDSSVAAYILKQQGYEVIGITLKLWDETKTRVDEACETNCEISGISDARRVCEVLNIPFYVVDLKEEFKKSVVDYFINSYIKGKTPNPCVVCNRRIKWGAILNKAKELGADCIATGHYAKIDYDVTNSRYILKNAQAKAKDQTYVLYGLTQEQLSRTLMPLGNYDKDQIRKIAKDLCLDIADKPDSQDICFIPNGDYVEFIKAYAKIEPLEGNFVDINGNILGRHKGIINYTVGQRKGLGISLGKRSYVSKIDALANTIVLSDEDELYSTTVFAKDLNFVSVAQIDGQIKCKGKIRYSQKLADCTVSFENEILNCVFDISQRAVAPGQALVIYEDDRVLCGGTII